MLENTDSSSSTQNKNKNKKLGFWFWLFVVFAVICAIMFVGAAISLLGVVFPGVFGGLSGVISNIPWIADVFSSILFNVIDVVIMPVLFAFCVREAKKEIKSHVTDENNHDKVEEVKKVDEVKVVKDEDKNKNEMKQNKEKNEIHLENKIDEDKINQDTNENNNKENKNNEVKERKPVKTVGEIADIFLADTLQMMSEGKKLNPEEGIILQAPRLLYDWEKMLEGSKNYFVRLPLRGDVLPIRMSGGHFGHGKLSITISSEHIEQKLNEMRLLQKKRDNEYLERFNKTQKREAQERQARDELRKKKQILPQTEDYNKDENKNM